MQAGKLNRRIIIQENTPAKDSMNQYVDNWQDSFTVWASVITTGGGEFYAAQKVNASTTAVFKVRYTCKITVKNRIKYGSRIFDILSLNDVDGMNVELQISAKEVV